MVKYVFEGDTQNACMLKKKVVLWVLTFYV